MKTRLVIFGVALLLLTAAILGAVAWTSRPSVVEIAPADGETNIAVTSQVRLGFSRSMDQESVIDHLDVEPEVNGLIRWEGNTLIFIPEGTWPGGRKISIRLEAGTRAASWLAFPMHAQSWSFWTSETNLAYLWPADGPADIYVLNPYSGDIQQYTEGMGVLEYTASKDGITIYFSAGNTEAGSDLYLIDRIAFSGRSDEAYMPRKLLDCGTAQCRSPAVSADGTLLAYEYVLPNPHGGLGTTQVWSMNIATGDRSPIGQATHETVQPTWSSTGWLGYYDRTSQAYELVNLKTDEGVQFVNQTGQPGEWSPDGNYYLAPEIYYYRTTQTSETGSSRLLRYNLQSGTVDDLSSVGDVEDVEGVYSLQGDNIAFARKYLDAGRWSFGRQLWIMAADGSTSQPLTDEADYNHYDLAWNQDGQLIAYVRFNQAKLSDPPELWMINADGSDPIQLVIGGYSPLWIP